DGAGGAAALVSAAPSQSGPIPNEDPCAAAARSGAPSTTRPPAQTRMVLVRWRADGHLDTRLAHRGWIRLAAGDFAPRRLLVEPDGATVLAGTARAQGRFVFAVRRYQTTGRLDEAF